MQTFYTVMNILIVSSRYFPEVGAAPVRIANMAGGLKKMGHSVDVLTCLPNHPENRIYEGYRHCISRKEVIDGINVFRYWTYASVSFNAFQRAVSMFAFAVTLWLFAFKVKRIKKYDYVILQTPPLVSAVSALRLFKGIYRKKIILNVSDLWPLTGVALGAMREGQLSYRYMAHLENVLYRESDGIIGQSDEILDYIKKRYPGKEYFLYRNLQPLSGNVGHRESGRHKPLKIVYAGMFGTAQDILSLVSRVNYEKLGTELHLYGGGGQLDDIKEFISEGHNCVTYHGFVSKEEMSKALREYDLSVITLSIGIYGAVPSKLFDSLPAGVPVLFCGGNEGARLVEEYGLGMISAPGDYGQLSDNIRSFVSMTDEDYSAYVSRCLNTAANEFSFDVQMCRLNDFLSHF